jgi:hypothetical protein
MSRWGTRRKPWNTSHGWHSEPAQATLLGLPQKIVRLSLTLLSLERSEAQPEDGS